MAKNTHKIGDIIAKLRKEKAWTQQVLADKLNVSDKAISKWESNKGDPSIEFLPKLAELFNVTIDYLMTGKEQELKFVTMSKLELCAKNDDPKIIDQLSYRSAYMKDEDGYSLMYYIKKYESLNVLKTLIDSCSYKSDYLSLFPQSQFDLPELLMLIKIDRERVVLKNITTSQDTIRLQLVHLGNFSIWYDNHYNGISEGYKNIVKYLIENYDKLTQEQQEYYFDLNGNNGLKKKNCWAPAYPYFIDIAYDCNRKLLENLIKRIEEGNEYYISELEKIRKARPDYDFWSCVERDQADSIKNNYTIVYPLEKTVLKMIECQEYDVAQRLNKYLKNKIGNDIFEHSKIKNNKKLSDGEKQKLLCVHEGILNVDEVLQINDFKTIKQMLEDYPICKYEMLSDWFEKKKYKEIYRFAIDNNLNDIASDVKNGEYEDLERKIKNFSTFGYGHVLYKYMDKRQNSIKKKSSEPYDGLYGFKGVMADVKSKILYELSLKLDKSKITEGLNREYFESELAKGNNEIVIVKLCVKLEAILKCDYHYTGTFEEMLNKYCDRFVPVDDENYTGYDNTLNLLNKLRMKRNNIVHSEQSTVELSEEDIRYCINFICKLDKEN